ncbi:VOC family protein [Haliangium ochraceum]|uniref:3-demethylubiquinone-9 3-methyltransferase n=1 Tax=Haliangium ochraceum (strain DSM 14365 / JCM 11303 / SMP-2) TaxID=502025 RepID=D0LSQ0_HALO1|nr:VOC family protein [Haliangium ochraceum]ACY17272.1 3-demethylubiquinone-9 3-methyltransferase [Haliangium ochraceum DSM 14365]
MTVTLSKITPCLWLDGNAEEAAAFYTSLLPDSAVKRIVRTPVATPSNQPGDVLTVEFTMAGHVFIALNGGPHFRFNEAISFQILCDDQAELDRLWSALSAQPESEQCGWVKDRFGVSWQIVPKRMLELLASDDAAAVGRAMEAMLQMKKLDIAAIEAAYAGTA